MSAILNTEDIGSLVNRYARIINLHNLAPLLTIVAGLVKTYAYVIGNCRSTYF